MKTYTLWLHLEEHNDNPRGDEPEYQDAAEPVPLYEGTHSACAKIMARLEGTTFLPDVDHVIALGDQLIAITQRKRHKEDVLEVFGMDSQYRFETNRFTTRHRDDPKDEWHTGRMWLKPVKKNKEEA